MSTEKKSRSRVNPTVLIAVIGLAGTLITAILTSPVLIALIEKEEPTEPPAAVLTEPPIVESVAPTEPPASPVPVTDAPVGPSGVLVFENTFEDGNTSGFVFHHGEWRISRDGDRSVLEGIGPAQKDQIASADFGNGELSDGMVEFQVKFKAFGGFLLNFRSLENELYTLLLDPRQSEITIGYNSEAADWVLEPFEGNDSRTFDYELNVWYRVRLDFTGEQVTLWVDNNRILSGSDSRLRAGGLNFVLQNGTEVYLDDVRVWELK